MWKRQSRSWQRVEGESSGRKSLKSGKCSRGASKQWVMREEERKSESDERKI